MFYGATVVVSAARITHTLYHCQLSDILTSYQLTSKNFEREGEKERETYIIF